MNHLVLSPNRQMIPQATVIINYPPFISLSQFNSSDVETRVQQFLRDLHELYSAAISNPFSQVGDIVIFSSLHLHTMPLLP